MPPDASGDLPGAGILEFMGLSPAPRRVIVFDIETTGLYPEEGHRILEITAIPVDGDRLLTDRRFDRLINPGVSIPADITTINGITDAMVAGAEPLERVLPEFLVYIEDYPLVAHNAGFDVHFIRFYARALGEAAVTNPVIDTRELSRFLFRGHGRHDLDSLLNRLGIPFDSSARHRALEDARLTALAYLKMKKLIGGMTI